MNVSTAAPRRSLLMASTVPENMPRISYFILFVLMVRCIAEVDPSSGLL